jgi:uncharacterized membrane protein YfcA
VEYELYHYIFVFFGVFFAGIVDSIAGGGGLITIPLYIAVGVPESLILGTNKTVSSVGALTAITRYIRSKAIAWKEGSIAICFSIIGSIIGAKTSSLLSTDYMMYLLLIILPTLLFLGKRIDFSKDEIKSKLNRNEIILRSSLIGLFIGFYDGFFGPGTGTFLIVSIFLFLHLHALRANATARVINFSSNIASFFYFAATGSIDFTIAFVGTGANILGNWLGSGLVLTKAKDIIKPVFNFVLILLFMKVLYSLLSKYTHHLF